MARVARFDASRVALTTCVLAAFAGAVAACSFPEVSFLVTPPVVDSGASPGLDLGTPDAGVSQGDDAAVPLDAGVAEHAASIDSLGDATIAGDGGCDFNGTWATRVTIDVTWQPQGLNTVILQSGSGTITQWVRGDRVQSPGAPRALIDDSIVCGITLPDFQATALGLNEVYGVRFPDTLFDDRYIPTFSVSGTLDPTMTSYSTTSTAVLLGLSMTNPTTDPWPSSATSGLTGVDQDNDGNPGVSIDVASGELANPPAIGTTSYSYIPTAVPTLLLPAPSASQLYVAIRQVTVTNGTVQDCNTIDGTVSIPVIGTKPAIDSHILGCAIVDGGPCSSSQASFVDNSQPVFAPSGKTTFRSVRVPKGASCAQVRAALPAP
ncbi:MAG: hypothetical protein ACRENE_14720 [Polyangiaceae bacterium]